MMILVFILLYGIVTIATSNINSNDIIFDNTNSNLNAGDMQEAIDEVFQHATDYNEIKTTIGDSTLTTTNKTLTGAVNELNSVLGLPSSASGVTGNDAFSKINTLNNNLKLKVSYSRWDNLSYAQQKWKPNGATVLFALCASDDTNNDMQAIGISGGTVVKIGKMAALYGVSSYINIPAYSNAGSIL